MSVPFVHAPDLKPGVHETLSPLITRIIAPNPGPFTYTGSGTYLLQAADETVVIDPGPDDAGHIALLAEKAPRPIKTILITHTHADHSGGANRLQSLTGAVTYGFGPHPTQPVGSAPALDEGADFGFAPDRELADGDRVPIEGLNLTAIHTPGHISNHLCFHLAEENALFTGDHMMGWATTVVAPPDGDMASYMKSLDLLLARDDAIYYPTHGAPITEPRAFVEAVKAHRLGRDHAVMTALCDGPRSIGDIVDEIYVGLAAPLKIAAGLNVLAHLEMHEAHGEVTRGDGGVFSLTRSARV
ncbi:MAG: MBL fold metallo-hydrolase [Pseudomonadota bacterium]